METATAVEIDKGRLRQLLHPKHSVVDYLRCLDRRYVAAADCFAVASMQLAQPRAEQTAQRRKKNKPTILTWLIAYS